MLLAEKEYELSGKLIGDDIGERATVRVDAIHSLSQSFFGGGGQSPCA